MRGRFRFSFLVAGLALSACHAHAPPQTDVRTVRNAPWTPLKTEAAETTESRSSLFATTASLWFGTYKNTVSRVDGNRCQFVPSCSRFAKDAVDSAGVAGIFLGFGRLLRPHNHNGFYRLNAQGFLQDDLPEYTFWWRTPIEDDFQSYSDPAHAWFQHIRLVR